jgi:CBS domain-containing protein
MRVNELMSTPPISVSPDRPLKDVAEVMLHHRVTALPVVDASGEIVGIISEADLLGIQASRLAAPLVRNERQVRVASDVMTRVVIVTGPETTVDDLVRLMVDHHVKRVPVVANGRLFGMISRTDVISVLARPDEDIEREMSEALRTDGLLIDPIGFEVLKGVVALWGVSAPGLQAHLQKLAYRIPGVIAVDITRDEPERAAELRSRASLQAESR